jgi:hypothetical protein
MGRQAAGDKAPAVQVNDPRTIGVGRGADPHCRDTAGIDRNVLDLYGYI